MNLLKVSKVSMFIIYCFVLLCANAYSSDSGQDKPYVMGGANVEKENIITYVGAETSFKAWAYSPIGYITKYEWDFDGDGNVDWSSKRTGKTTYIYNTAGEYTAVFRAYCVNHAYIPELLVKVIVAENEQEAKDMKAGYRDSIKEEIDEARAVNPADGVQKKYAIVINGADSSDNRFWYAVNFIYEMLIDQGLPASDIYVFSLDGKDPWGNENAIIDYPATKANLQMVCNDLALIADADDILYFWYNDHGYGYYGTNIGFGNTVSASVDPEDEQDYLEKDFKLSALSTYNDYLDIDIPEYHKNHGLGTWECFYRKGKTNEMCRYKYISHTNSVYIESEGGSISDSDEDIERLVDYLVGDINKNGRLEPEEIPLMNTNNNNIFGYDHHNDVFDEEDWGVIDSFEDNYNKVNTGVPGGDYKIFDDNTNNCVDLHIGYKEGDTLKVHATDKDNNGLFDGVDVNTNGNLNDWVSIDELVQFNKENLSDDELKEYLQPINVEHMEIYINACFSGGFIDDLSSNNRVVMAATEEEDLGSGDAFIGFLASTFSGKPYIEDYNEPIFINPILDADTDGDGIINLLESFNYSAGLFIKLNIDKRPCYDDNGDGIYSFYPLPNNGDGGYGENIYTGATLDKLIMIYYDTFENGWGNYTNAGTDAYIYNGEHVSEGNYAACIRNKNNLICLNNILDLVTPKYIELVIKYTVYTHDFDNSDEGFWIDYFDGREWIIVDHKSQYNGLENNKFSTFTLNISYNDYMFSKDSKIRFRSDTDNDDNELYFDEIFIYARKNRRSVMASGNDIYTVEMNKVLIVDAPGILENDFVPPGTSFSARIVPQHNVKFGELELFSDGGFIYTPKHNFIGEDRFSYYSTIHDDDDSIATVRIFVEGYNPADGIEDKYTLIINESGKQEYWDNAAYIYDMLLRFNYTDDDIFLINDNGLSPDGINPHGMIDYPATEPDIEQALEEIAAKVDLDDLLFIWTFGEANGYIRPGNEEDLDHNLEQIGVKAMGIIMGQNFGGGYVEYLSRPNRVIMTAAEKDSVSYGNTFIRNLINAFSGLNYPGGTTEDPLLADIDGDGAINMVEGFNFAVKYDDQPENPCYDDNGDGIYSHYDLPNDRDGILGHNFAMGEIQPNWEVIRYDGFEDGWGNYTSGGIHASITNAHAIRGINSVNIEGADGILSSFYLTKGIDLITDWPYFKTVDYSQILVTYDTYAISIDNTNEGYWIDYYDGTHWEPLFQARLGNGFLNDFFSKSFVAFNNQENTFSKNSKIRFRCDASGPGDDIFIDDVYIKVRALEATKPTPAADTYFTKKNQTLTVEYPGILENDYDPKGVYYIAILNTNLSVSNGSLTFNGDGSFEYIPDTDFIGGDSFYYHMPNDLNYDVKVTIIVRDDLFRESFETRSGTFQNVMTYPAPYWPRGADGDFVGKFTIPATYGGKRSSYYKYREIMDIEGAEELTVKALLGLRYRERGDCRFRMNIYFNNNIQINSEWHYFNYWSRYKFRNYEDVITVPEGADFIKMIKLELRQFNGSYMPEQTAYIDKIIIDN